MLWKKKGSFLLRFFPGSWERQKKLGSSAFQVHRESPQIHRKNSHASPTPCFDGKRIYVHFGNLGTACLSLNGEVLWKKRYDYSPVHGGGSSPVVHGELLIFSADGYSNPCLYALEKNTGRSDGKPIEIAKPRKNFSFCTPLVIESEDRVQIVSPASDYVFAYDLEGRQIWKSKYPGGYSVVPRPVYGDGMVFVSSGYDRPSTYAIKVNGTGDVTKTHAMHGKRASRFTAIHRLCWCGQERMAYCSSWLRITVW